MLNAAALNSAQLLVLMPMPINKTTDSVYTGDYHGASEERVAACTELERKPQYTKLLKIKK